MRSCPRRYKLLAKGYNNTMLCKKIDDELAYPDTIIIDKDHTVVAHQFEKNHKSMCRSKKIGNLLTCDIIRDNDTGEMIYTNVDIKLKKKKRSIRNKKMSRKKTYT